jgi:hypothetical protein
VGNYKLDIIITFLKDRVFYNYIKTKNEDTAALIVHTNPGRIVLDLSH